MDLEKKWEVIKCYEKKEDEYNYSISEITKITNVSKTTLYRYIKLWS